MDSGWAPESWTHTVVLGVVMILASDRVTAEEYLKMGKEDRIAPVFRLHIIGASLGFAKDCSLLVKELDIYLRRCLDRLFGFLFKKLEITFIGPELKDEGQTTELSGTINLDAQDNWERLNKSCTQPNEHGQCVGVRFCDMMYHTFILPEHDEELPDVAFIANGDVASRFGDWNYTLAILMIERIPTILTGR